MIATNVYVWKFNECSYRFQALEKAKEAGRLEKSLRQSRERTMASSPGASPDTPNFDLTYSVSIELSSQLQKDSVLVLLNSKASVVFFAD